MALTDKSLKQAINNLKLQVLLFRKCHCWFDIKMKIKSIFACCINKKLIHPEKDMNLFLQLAENVPHKYFLR